MATMLDPRFIKAYFQGPMTTANTMTLLEMEVRQLMREGAAACARAVHDADPPLEPAPAPAAGQNQSLWASHAELARSANAATATDDVAARAKAEIRAYISRELLPITADPLKRWEAIKPLYPNLYIVAQKYLSILATSLPSERLFSKLSFISTEETSRLTAEHLSQRVFLASIEKDMWEAARVPK
ncbi:zinc finger BED domain-containing protein 4-like [Frankliniella occidentalis]|uniref:Zinc finger BED domain-containing protein 4-like n=1 Tax=Frankliniella occidentalis TaxID=133901 RepID=A0A9C6X3V6_FRAOC|nr:zinc finger BED domain-containing protein 4-like [Frankliniella occidentalis]